MASSKFKAFWNHPAGLKTIVAASGLIWTQYGMVITPRNWNLCSVNFAMSMTGFCQLSRKLRHDVSTEREPAPASASE